MTPSEEIDLLKRQIADLTDRVRLLEACARSGGVRLPSPLPSFVPASAPVYTPRPSTLPWVTTCGGAQ